MKNKLLTTTLQEAMILLQGSGYEEDQSYRFVKLEEDFTQKEARIYKTALGFSVHFEEERAL